MDPFRSSDRLKGRADDAYNVNETRRRGSLIIFMYSCISFSNRKMDRYASEKRNNH